MSTNLSPEPAPTDRKRPRGVLVALAILAALVVLVLMGFVISGGRSA
jgi:hypothetical protein